jgi:hypothetical protein
MANYDQLVADILSIEDLYNPAEWAVIETLVAQLLEEARFFGVEPRDHAAERLATLNESINDNGPLNDGAEDLRTDLAMAAALVYVGRDAP